MRQGPSTTGRFHLHCPTGFVGKSPSGEGREEEGREGKGEARGPEEGEPLGVEDEGRPRCRRPSRVGLSARAPSPPPPTGGSRRRAPSGISGRRRASPSVPGKLLPAPGTQRGISPAPSRRATLPPLPPGPRERGSPAFPPPQPDGPRSPLTPETWRPGPGRRRSERGSLRRARSSGTAGGDRDGAAPPPGHFPPGGRRRGREGRRPRCVNPFGAADPLCPPRAPPATLRPASITPRFSEAEPGAAEGAESPKVTRSERGRLSRDFAPGYALSPVELPGSRQPVWMRGNLDAIPPSPTSRSRGAGVGSKSLWLHRTFPRREAEADQGAGPSPHPQAAAPPSLRPPSAGSSPAPPRDGLSARSAAFLFHPSTDISLKTLFVPKPLLIYLCVCQARSS